MDTRSKNSIALHSSPDLYTFKLNSRGEVGDDAEDDPGDATYPSHFLPVDKHLWQLGRASSHLMRLTSGCQNCRVRVIG